MVMTISKAGSVKEAVSRLMSLVERQCCSGTGLRDGPCEHLWGIKVMVVNSVKLPLTSNRVQCSLHEALTPWTPFLPLKLIPRFHP